MASQSKRQLRGDEGVVRAVYQDHLGYYTIGVGRLVDERKGGGLSDDEIDYLLANDVAKREKELDSRLSWWRKLDDARQGVLLNMAFQMGVDGLLGFKNTLELVKAGRYDAAAAGMMNSKWAVQTPERAQRLADQMRSGQWRFAPGY
jgi:lysozyme